MYACTTAKPTASPAEAPDPRDPFDPFYYPHDDPFMRSCYACKACCACYAISHRDLELMIRYGILCSVIGVNNNYVMQLGA